jgi:diadenosine tetraphosphate (Ap4A) HIT family hydrolase
MTTPDPKVVEVLEHEWFPFATDLTVKPLDSPVIPEPDRVGERGVDCPTCAMSDADYIWSNDRWRLRPYKPTPIRGIVLLETRDHYDSFSDFAPELSHEIGPTIARIERAILGIGGIGRVHVNRWGDGGEHFHLWFMPRPLGQLQMRGSPFPIWLDVLPALPDDEVDAAFEAIASGIV